MYTSESLALALLEKMAHLRDYEQLLDAFVAVRAAFDEQFVRELEVFRHVRRHRGTKLSEPPPEEDSNSPWTLQIDETDITTTVYGDWKAVSSRSKTQALGDKWARSQISPVLQVPSIILPIEHNYLINPEHEGFEEIRVYDPEDLPVDPRLTEG